FLQRCTSVPLQSRKVFCNLTFPSNTIFNLVGSVHRGCFQIETRTRIRILDFCDPGNASYLDVSCRLCRSRQPSRQSKPVHVTDFCAYAFCLCVFDSVPTKTFGLADSISDRSSSCII